MTVGDLRKRLKGLKSDLQVVVAADGEGNGFANLDDVQISHINTYGEPVHDDDAEADWPLVCVMWPVG